MSYGLGAAEEPWSADGSASWGNSWSQGLWVQISSWLKPQEVEEVRRAIGNNVIDRNEDLIQEVAALSEILDDFREQNNMVINEKRKSAQARKALLGSGAERQLLEQQIKLLLNDLNTKNQRGSPNGVDRDSKVYQYVMGGGGSISANNTARSTARPDSSCSRRSARSAPDQLESLAGNLNADGIDRVLEAVRELFRDEERSLKDEVEEIMALLEDEDADRSRALAEADAPVPSNKELREYGAQLQKDAVRADGRVPEPAALRRPLAPRGMSSMGAADPFGGAQGKAPLPSLHSLGNSLPDPSPLKRRSKSAAGQPPVVPSLNLGGGGGSTSSSVAAAAASSSTGGGGGLEEPPPPVVAKAPGRKRGASRFRDEVASAQETARDDYHLSDERFFV